jgi:hypothetical protein
MKFVENASRMHRTFSVQAMALAAAIQGVWPSIPDDLKATLPHNLVHWVSIVLLVAGIFGRMVDQGSITEPQPPKDSQ